MTQHKELGKITFATFGVGGYQDCQIGFWLSLGGESWGVSTSGGGAWATKRGDDAKWTEADRIAELGNAAMKLCETLKLAKKRLVQDLVGIPVEAIFEGNELKSWRVLTEVL
jgi:hypothetical protein